jgi:predicted glycosyltransferase
MRVMFYCQHVLGIGHFFRAMEVARALDRHEVLFVEGGAPLPGFEAPAHVERVFLPPLMMDADFQDLHTARGDLETIRDERRQRLMACFECFRPEVLVIELFPFGRKRFGYEILPLLERIRDQAPGVRVACSLRDILVEKQDVAAYEERVVSTLNCFFHLLLVHTDPRVVSLDETFARLGDVRIPVEYTGFVAKRVERHARPHAGNTMVAGSGGGKVGADLLAAVVRALRLLPDPDLRLRVFLGPFMESRDRQELAELARADGRVALLPFSLDYAGELAAADLSISMAGYNTCMDILSTGVPALVYPFRQNREQALRAHRLQSLGLLKVIEDLTDSSLAAAIRTALDGPNTVPVLAPDLGGAAKSALLVESLVRSH